MLLIFYISSQGDDDDDDWGEDTTEEAQRRRMDEISDHAKVLTLTDDLERTIEERVNILFDFVKVKAPLLWTHSFQLSGLNW